MLNRNLTLVIERFRMGNLVIFVFHPIIFHRVVFTNKRTKNLTRISKESIKKLK